jgi:hypothetical protein
MALLDLQGMETSEAPSGRGRRRRNKHGGGSFLSLLLC